ncbi:MAG TPA: hypothetical protein VFW65_21830 [Pseudonocardiaceae bacterium]|nr:hypothetical protein [Pseudonocardiaceae bacterium]
MTETPTISSEDMAGLVAGREALPLLPEGAPGPVQHAGMWWAIPTGETDYRPVTDPAQIVLLDRNTQRYAAARVATARAREDGGSP